MLSRGGRRSVEHLWYESLSVNFKLLSLQGAQFDSTSLGWQILLLEVCLLY